MPRHTSSLRKSHTADRDAAKDRRRARLAAKAGHRPHKPKRTASEYADTVRYER